MERGRGKERGSFQKGTKRQEGRLKAPFTVNPDSNKKKKVPLDRNNKKMWKKHHSAPPRRFRTRIQEPRRLEEVASSHQSHREKK